MTTFAFIGFGEAGGLLAAGLIASGAKVLATYDILINDPAKSPMLIEKAQNKGIIPAENPEQAINRADIVISAVVSDQMLIAAQSVIPHLKKGQIYFDINSASPMTKQQAALLVGKTGAHFVEAAVMDLVPPHGHKVPMLLAGGMAVQVENSLRAYGMQVKTVGETIGTASTIKMVRSVFLKGFSAILLECLVAAGKIEAEEEVIDSLQVTFPQLDWRNLADYYAARLIKHAGRQAAEMREVADTLEYLRIEPLMAMASAERLDWLAKYQFDQVLSQEPNGYKSLLRMLSQ